MKRAYRKPLVIQYDREDVADMMGPVKAQYTCDCDVTVQPDPIDGKQFSTVTITVDISQYCPDFDIVTLSVPGSDPDLSQQWNRADGTEVGGTWQITLPNFQYLGNAGDYDFIIELYEPFSQSPFTSCETTVTIQ